MLKPLRHPMLLLSLLAALAATPLRLAEAAHDFADSLAEGGVAAVEVPDGGVGDDPNDSLKSAPTAVPARDAFAEILPELTPPPPRFFLPPTADPPRPPERLTRRLALLQNLLF